MAGLRQRCPRTAERDRGQENRRHQRPVDRHVALHAVALSPYQPSQLTGRRFKGLESGTPASAQEQKYEVFSVGCGNSRHCGRGHLPKSSCPFKRVASGEMAEWLKAHAWKACVRETVPWVRIPLSPPMKNLTY